MEGKEMVYGRKQVRSSVAMWRQEVERVWAGLSEEVIREVTRWRSEHPRATFKEVEEAVDGSLSRVRA